MKIFIKNSLVNFALILIVNTIIESIGTEDYLNSVSPLLEVLFLTLLIQLSHLLIIKISFRYPIFEYLLEFGIVTVIVFSYGWLFGWTMNIWWLILIIIAIVYVMMYMLDLLKINKDIAFINEQIKQRHLNSTDESNNQ